MAQKKKVTVKPTGSPLAAAFAASESAGQRNPLFDAGTHKSCVFQGLEQPDPVAGKDPWMRANFTDADGQERTALFCMSQRSLGSSLPRLKSLIMAVIGCDDLDAYNEFDPAGEFFSAFCGYENEFSEQAAAYVGSATLDVIVTKGKETDEGDYFRNVSFACASEGE